MPKHILPHYGLDAAAYTVEPFGPGLINHTYKVSGAKNFILQQVNSSVFKSAGAIAENLAALQHYLAKNYTEYLFVAPLETIDGRFLIIDEAGKFWRLFPFIEGSYTINAVQNEKQAYEAAKQFGKFTRLLTGFDAGELKYTLPDFHNLKLRFEQFEKAKDNASQDRAVQAANEISTVYHYSSIVDTYNRLIAKKDLPLRVIHHDTKISNVLFNQDQQGLCVIDLDTVMPGYFLSDVGDMMRTYLSPANEEETDLDKVFVRENIFTAICDGYLFEMAPVLTDIEKQQFIFAGKMMIYMQALRFLTDFLNNDTYYGSRYPEHNLVRAKNQFKLLEDYIKAETRLKPLAEKYLKTHY